MWMPLSQAAHLADDGGLSRFLDAQTWRLVPWLPNQKSAGSRRRMISLFWRQKLADTTPDPERPIFRPARRG